jgi:hypothetical protein
VDLQSIRAVEHVASNPLGAVAGARHRVVVTVRVLHKKNFTVPTNVFVFSPTLGLTLGLNLGLTLGGGGGGLDLTLDGGTLALGENLQLIHDVLSGRPCSNAAMLVVLVCAAGKRSGSAFRRLKNWGKRIMASIPGLTTRTFKGTSTHMYHKVHIQVYVHS